MKRGAITMKKIPIGRDNFKDIIEKDFYKDYLTIH